MQKRLESLVEVRNWKSEKSKVAQLFTVSQLKKSKGFSFFSLPISHEAFFFFLVPHAKHYIGLKLQLTIAKEKKIQNLPSIRA